MKISIQAHEISHGGDLYNLEEDCRESGGTVLTAYYDESETGYLSVAVDDLDDFKARMDRTGSEGFYRITFVSKRKRS